MKPIEWCFYKNKQQKFSQILNNKIVNSQYLRQAYILNGAIYIMKRDVVFGKKIDFKNVDAIEMPFERSIDIDDINDFYLAKSLQKIK